LLETNLSYGVSAGTLGDNSGVRAIGGVSRDDLGGVGNARSSGKRRTGCVGPGSGHTGRGSGSAGRRGGGGVGAGRRLPLEQRELISDRSIISPNNRPREGRSIDNSELAKSVVFEVKDGGDRQDLIAST